MEFERTQHYGLAFCEVTHQLGFLMGMRSLLADLADYASVYMVTFLLIGWVNGKVSQIIFLPYDIADWGHDLHFLLLNNRACTVGDAGRVPSFSSTAIGQRRGM